MYPGKTYQGQVRNPSPAGLPVSCTDAEKSCYTHPVRMALSQGRGYGLQFGLLSDCPGEGRYAPFRLGGMVEVCRK